MSGPLSDKPDGTTINAQVAINCLPAEDLHNKKLIFISGVLDDRTFLLRLQASSPGCLTTQLKAEKLMVVTSTANWCRAAASALWSFDGGV